MHLALVVFTDEYVARQQQPDLRNRADGLVGQRRVAGAEYPVGRHVLTQFFLQGGLDVDLRQYAEAFLVEFLGDRLDRLLEAEVDGFAESEFGIHQCASFLVAGSPVPQKIS